MPKIEVRALIDVGAYKAGDLITCDVYPARVLVAMGKAKFEHARDDVFKQFQDAQRAKRQPKSAAALTYHTTNTTPESADEGGGEGDGPKRGRRNYQRRDMVPE